MTKIYYDWFQSVSAYIEDHIGRSCRKIFAIITNNDTRNCNYKKQFQISKLWGTFYFAIRVDQDGFVAVDMFSFLITSVH